MVTRTYLKCQREMQTYLYIPRGVKNYRIKLQWNPPKYFRGNNYFLSTNVIYVFTLRKAGTSEFT